MSAPPADDIDCLMQVMESAFDPHWGEAWTRRQVEDSLTLPHTHYYLRTVPDGDDRRGAAFALVRAAPGEEELLLLAVAPERRGTGLGRAVLADALAAARDRGAEAMFLEMRENNSAARFYEAAGFRPIGRRKAYYRTSDGDRLDAITYRMLVP